MKRINLRTLRYLLLAYCLFDWFIGYAGFFPMIEVAAAQFTTVSGTVTDPNGLPYGNGTIQPILVISGSPKFTTGGASYSPPISPTGLSLSGSFVLQLADNTQLSPGGSTWSFRVSCGAGCIPTSGGTGPQTFTVTGITISGSSQSITAQLNAAAPALSLIVAGTGGVTNIATGAGLTGGPITNSGTISVATAGITNAMLANPSMTVNSQACALGASCTIPFQTNGVANASQAGHNVVTSTANAVGLTITPVNTGTNVDTFEISGANYTGNAATATLAATATTAVALASTPTNCGPGVSATGVASSGNAVGCFTPGAAPTAIAAGQNPVSTAAGASYKAQTKQKVDLRDANLSDMCTNAVTVAKALGGADIILPCGYACHGGANNQNYCEPGSNDASLQCTGGDTCQVESYANQQACATDPMAGLWGFNPATGAILNNGGKITLQPIAGNACVLTQPAGTIRLGKEALLDGPFNARGSGNGIYFANNAAFDAEAAKRNFVISAAFPEEANNGVVSTQNAATGGCAGNCVTLISGTSFTGQTGTIIINGVNFTISSVQSSSVLTLTTAPGTQTTVVYENGAADPNCWTYVLNTDPVADKYAPFGGGSVQIYGGIAGVTASGNNSLTGAMRVIRGDDSNTAASCHGTGPRNAHPYSFTVWNTNGQQCSGVGNAAGQCGTGPSTASPGALTAVFPTPNFCFGGCPWDLIGSTCTGGSNDGTSCASNAACTGGGTCTGPNTARCIKSGGDEVANSQCFVFQAQLHNIGVLDGGVNSTGEEAVMNAEGEEGSAWWSDGSLVARAPYGLYEKFSSRAQNTLGVFGIEDYCNDNATNPEHCQKGQSGGHFAAWDRDILSRHLLNNATLNVGTGGPGSLGGVCVGGSNPGAACTQPTNCTGGGQCECITGQGCINGGGLKIDAMGFKGVSNTVLREIHIEDSAFNATDGAICIGCQNQSSGVLLDSLEWTPQSGNGFMYKIGGSGISSDIVILNSACPSCNGTAGNGAGHIRNTQSARTYKNGNIAFYAYSNTASGVNEWSSSAEFPWRVDAGMNMFNSNPLQVGDVATTAGGATTPAVVLKQFANGADTLFGYRATDSAATGNFLNFMNNAQTLTLFGVSTNGIVTLGTNAPSVVLSGTTPFLNMNALQKQTKNTCIFNLGTAAFTTGLSPVSLCTFTLPGNAQSWYWTCELGWSNAAGTTPTFSEGVTWAQAPSVAFQMGSIFTTNTGTSTQLTTTTTTNANILTTGTLTPAATVFQATMSGTFTGSGTSGVFSPTLSLTGAGANGTAAGACTMQ